MEANITEQSTVTAAPGLTTEYTEEGEAIIQRPNDQVYYGLNTVGGRVWSLIQNPVKVKRILDVLLLEYDVQVDRCLEEVLTLINELVEMGLAETSNAEAG